MLEEQNAVLVSTYKETYKEVSAVIVSILIVCVRVLVVFGVEQMRFCSEISPEILDG
jgi:hypothetical protein